MKKLSFTTAALFLAAAAHASDAAPAFPEPGQFPLFRRYLLSRPESTGTEATQLKASFHGATTATSASVMPTAGEALQILAQAAGRKISETLSARGLPPAQVLYKLLHFPLGGPSTFGFFIIADMPAALGYCFFCNDTVSGEIGKDLLPAGAATTLPFGINSELFKNLVPHMNERLIYAAHEEVRSFFPPLEAAFNDFKAAYESDDVSKMTKAEAFKSAYNQEILSMALAELTRAASSK